MIKVTYKSLTKGTKTYEADNFRIVEGIPFTAGGIYITKDDETVVYIRDIHSVEKVEKVDEELK